MAHNWVNFNTIQNDLVSLIQFDDELVTNGTFDTDTSGWTAADSAILTVVGNKLHIENGAAIDGIARQVINVEIGETYRFRAARTQTTGAVGKIELRDAGNSLILQFIDEAVTDATFVATTATVTINLSPNNSGIGVSVEFDDVMLSLSTSIKLVKKEADERDYVFHNMPLVDVRLKDSQNEVRAGRDYYVFVTFEVQITTFDLSDFNEAATLRDTILSAVVDVVRNNANFSSQLETSRIGLISFSNAKDEDSGAFMSAATVEVIAEAFIDRG